MLYAFTSFYDLFNRQINQLLYNFPPDTIDKSSGTKFWTGSKRVPVPNVYSVDDELSISYVVSYSILLARSLNIKEPEDPFTYIKEKTKNIEMPKFVPKKVHIKVNENDNNEGTDVMISQEDEDEKLSECMKSLSIFENTKNLDQLKPQYFEKDDDSNFHIDFINALSNLRARNYRINECDRFKTKLIAGKIIPAIATTTSSVTGLVALQLLTCLQTDKLESMRSSYLNLAVNLYIMTEPGPKIEKEDKKYDQILLGPVKAIPSKWTCWDKITIKGSMTFGELIDYFLKEYDCEVSVVECNGKSLLLQWSSSFKNKLGVKIEDEYEKISGEKIIENNLPLGVTADLTDGVTSAILPLVKYVFK